MVGKDGFLEQVDRSGTPLLKVRQPPDYKVGGWVVTDLGELARIAGIKDKSNGRHLRLEIDEGEQSPTEKLFSVQPGAPVDDRRSDSRGRPRGSNGARPGYAA